MTAAEKAAEKAKQEVAQGAAPADKAGQNAEQAGLDLQTATTQEQAATLLEAQTPEWVAEVLESHMAVLESNAAVIQAVADFKESANELIAKIGSTAGPVIQEATEKVAPVQFDPFAEYEVAEGQEFRAPNDFTTIHKEGENVSHLGEATLTRLLQQGLVTEVEPDKED